MPVLSVNTALAVLDVLAFEDLAARVWRCPRSPGASASR